MDPTTKERHIEKKKTIDDLDYMRYMSEARAYSNLSQERPLTDDEFNRYKEVCRRIGIKT